jgi:CRP/FNR family cyclic AMP-dependent transcriptional regulator
MHDPLAQIRASLARTTFTSKWPDKAVAELGASAEMRACRDGERVVATGDHSDEMWIATEGRFLLSRTWPNGRRFVYSTLRPGEAAGVQTIFDGGAAPLDLTARGNAAAITIPGETLRAIARKYPGVAVELIGYLCRRTRTDLEAIERHAMNSVRCRIAKSILAIAGDRMSSGREADTKISQDDLADIVCAARQSVNRELRRLMKEGVIKQRYRAIVVLDRERLLRVAIEDEDLSPAAYVRLERAIDHVFPATD